ncbi:hypothetical protein [Aeromonas phage ZPAH34]|uniref:hypothetical protein n=1 Tax=Aeromonas phage ZPAH34 TaxID=2924888 RepID=UPI002329517B|nr:hypothetical protein PQD16_gp119 [Aeromonas phage ZPAH34]UOX39564.1 hypothetical protein [Aeromonas phage ZPAH34]
MHARLIDIINYAKPDLKIKDFHEMLCSLHDGLKELMTIPDEEVGIKIKEKMFIVKYLSVRDTFIFNTDDKGVTWCVINPFDKSHSKFPVNTFSLLFTEMLSKSVPNRKINELFKFKGIVLDEHLINHNFCYDVLMAGIRAVSEEREYLSGVFPYMIGKSKAFISYTITDICETGFSVDVTGGGMLEFMMTWDKDVQLPSIKNMENYVKEIRLNYN